MASPPVNTIDGAAQIYHIDMIVNSIQLQTNSLIEVASSDLLSHLSSYTNICLIQCVALRVLAAVSSVKV